MTSAESPPSNRPDTQVLVESLVFGVAGLVGIAEGMRLSASASGDLYQMLGPGAYIAGLSVTLVLLGLIHFFSRRPQAAPVLAEPEAPGQTMRAVAVVGLLAVDAVLLHLAGYVVATFVLFILAFRLLGVPSWARCALLAACAAAVFHFIFVRFCGVVFPQGALW